MTANTDRHVISLDDIRQAAERIAAHVVRTPAIKCEPISKRLRCDVYFKAENLQHVGAFKSRGAVNAVMSMSEDDARRGVVTHSSGNHAAAIARAAKLRGIPAYVVMPENSSPKKIAAVQSFGVQPVLCGPSNQEREAAADALQQQTGAILIHPFETPAVMAGQGTVGLELLEQIASLDAVFVPVGGGGLLAGVLTAIKALRPEVKVFAVEPALADDTARSLKAGHPSATRHSRSFRNSSMTCSWSTRHRFYQRCGPSPKTPIWLPNPPAQSPSPDWSIVPKTLPVKASPRSSAAET